MASALKSLTSQPRKPLVLVIWNDANTGADDAIDDDNVHAYHKPTVVTTLGWVMKEDTEGITVCNEYYDRTYRGRTFVHRPMIIDVVPCKLTQPTVRKAKPQEATTHE